MTTQPTPRPDAATVTYRPFDPATDYAAAAELIRDAHRHDAVDWLPTGETLAHEFAHEGSFRSDADALVALSGGAFVGLAKEAWRQRGEKVVHNLEIWVRPAARRQRIGTALLHWGERHVAVRVRAGEGGPTGLPHEIGGWGELAVPGHAELAAAHGYRVVRYGMEMHRPVDGPIPDSPLPLGLEVRPVRPADHRRIWEADVEAFRDHWEASVRPESDYAWWFSRPYLDTSLWQVAWAGDEVAGSILTTLDPEENVRLGVNRAWLDHISVRRPWRRRGLAASLIASTLRLLKERGIEEAALGADTENTSGAVRLYERMGFVRAHTGAIYRKPIEL